ncbi:hypothetical protein KJK32_45325 [Streptomyces sp. JCM17656]|nr:hypothetical protein KJK32_45325 [Streptomyces sp. JCM17656]
MPSMVRPAAQGRIQAIVKLAARLEHADAAMAGDPAEWHRTLLRTVADLAEAAGEAAIELTKTAMDTKALTPTEIAKASRVTRATVYSRAKGSGSSRRGAIPPAESKRTIFVARKFRKPISVGGQPAVGGAFEASERFSKEADRP